jgi:hypothetical protein
MQNIYRALVPGLIALLLTAGCNNDEVKTTDGTDTTGNREVLADTGSLQVFTVPTPLQVSTVMLMEKERFVTQYLDRASPPTNFASNDKRAMALGAYLVDMGYACMYDHRQVALNYAKSVQKMMDDLGITSAINIQVARRIEANLNNNDSLYSIILESYNSAHNYFRDNGREETGLFIMAGGYIEGLNLLLQSKRSLSSNQLRNMVGQQKIFLENIIKISGFMEDKPKVKELRSTLEDLYTAFSGMAVEVRNTEDGTMAVSCAISPGDMKKLAAKVAALRAPLVTP